MVLSRCETRKHHCTYPRVHRWPNGERLGGFRNLPKPRHFADVYAWYLTEGPSSYRYRNYRGMGRLVDATTTEEFFKILKNGGYATDPAYVSKAQSIVASVERRYGELIA
ncbi:lytic enzyme [Pseudomonas phage ER16]|nr:lytic enzyme [Pseudomonas phage ER16]